MEVKNNQPVQQPIPNQHQPLHHANRRKVIVTKYPPYSETGDLQRAFAKFGPVNVEVINSKFATLSFETPEAAKAATNSSGKLNIYGEFVIVRPYTESKLYEITKNVFTPKNKPNQPKPVKGRTDILPSLLDLTGAVDQQIEKILAAVRLTQEEVAKLATLFMDLESTLSQVWPGCKAIPFGSITTGLGVKSSDADCFVLLPNSQRHVQNQISRARKLLLAKPQLFQDILSIPRANTPIVKFYHVPTETHCDLSFKTPLGVQNSKLIAFLLHADPRLIPMAVIIKYWAKSHDLSGTGKLSNYALTMLIIFYLQQPPLIILPSVQWLQTDQANDIIVDFWNTGIMNKKESLPQCLNTSSVIELIGGFFEYYSKFRFDEMMVCPFLGRPIAKKVFDDYKLVPPEFERYKNNVKDKLTAAIRCWTSICIQDPLEQCHNVASAINQRFGMEMIAFFKFAANAYEKNKFNKYEKFLSTILLEKPRIARLKNHPEYRAIINHRIVGLITDPDWKAVVRKILFHIFQVMLKIRLDKIEEKINVTLNRVREKYKGAVTKAIWKRSQFAKLKTDPESDFSERQAQITEEVIKAEKEVVDIQFSLTITFHQNQPSVTVAVRLNFGELFPFKDFGRFIVFALNSWFTILLKPYTQENDKYGATKIAEALEMNEANEQEDRDSEEDIILPSTVTNSTGQVADS